MMDGVDTMTRVQVKPELLRWACERAGVSALELSGRFAKFDAWESGKVQPTLRQLEAFANAVHVPIGYLFLDEPPSESLPIPDFRTLANLQPKRPSPNLLDTLYLCQQRQEWFHDYARLHGFSQIEWIGSVRVQDEPETVADAMRQTLAFSINERRKLPNWTEALRRFIEQMENAGVLVMASSIVGSNSHRKLEVSEFRGFSLADAWAPLVFINADDSKSAQMFSLAHELAHLWLGKSGISNTEAGRVPTDTIERWCNQVAAELLMPKAVLKSEYRLSEPVEDALARLSRVFKVSSLVVLRRLFEAALIDQDTLWKHYQKEVERIQKLERKGSGSGNFYHTLGARTGKRFARAVLCSTLEGHTLFQDAFRMLGMCKTATFEQAARKLGVTL